MALTVDSRKTGCVLQVVDDHWNDWEDFAGQDINIPVAYQTYTDAQSDDDPATYPPEWAQAHWSYRGQAAMCKTMDGTKIVRVRLGDGITAADRTIYKQEITDPTVVSQWTTWVQLYTGDHFAVAVEPTTGSTFRVIHAKSDGIYANNVLKLAVTGVTRIKPILHWPGAGAIKYQVVSQDDDGERRLDWHHVSDITAAASVADAANYRWYRSDMAAAYYDLTASTVAAWDDAVYVTRAFAEGHARSQIASAVMTSTWANRTVGGGHNQWQGADYIKGPSGQAGFHVIDNMQIAFDGATDGGGGAGNYFLVWNEQHRDVPGNILSNLLNPVFWSYGRSLPGEKWSEPTPVGYTIWGLAGYVFFGNYAYLAGNGRVLRRSTVVTTIDLSNYVGEGTYDLPRGSQPGSAEITLANPDNVVGSQLGLIGTSEAGSTDRRVVLQIGYRRELDTAWTWKEATRWWIAAMSKQTDGPAERVKLTLGDFMYPLSHPFREAISIPGNMTWSDWEVGGAGRSENYHNDTSEFYRTGPNADGSYSLLNLGGDTVFTGWRGENGGVFAVFSTVSGRLLFRYQDKFNYYYAEYTGTQVRVGSVINNVKTILGTASVAATSSFYLYVDFRWAKVDVYYNYTLVLPVLLTSPEPLVGFVGFGAVAQTPFTITKFRFNEWNKDYTTGGLLARLIAYSGVTQRGAASAAGSAGGWGVDREDAQAKQLNVLWGPQSDLDTPAKAFAQYLGTGNLEAVSTIDSSGRQTITIGRFDDKTEDDVEVTIDNEIIRHDHTNDGRERPNVVVVDGQVNSWTEYDRADLLNRQREVVRYIDAPELNTPGEVRSRAQNETLDARRYNSPGGEVVFNEVYDRMLPCFWIDEQGNKFFTRIEGIHAEWNLGTQPFQRQSLDMGTFIYCPPVAAPASYIARDTFQRDTSSGWSDAQIGGSWSIT